MKTVLYLIQAAAGLPEIYTCLRKRDFLILSYKEETADTTIFAPKSTWTEGRNLLYNYVREKGLLYDYFVFIDEDVVFQKPSLVSYIYTSLISMLGSFQDFTILMNQEAGFASLEATLELGYPIVNIQFRNNGENLKRCIIQTITHFDGILNAVSKEVFFANTVLPYEEKYDSKSWWLSQAIFILKAHYYYFMQIIQNNQFKIHNLKHGKYPQKAIEWNEIYKLVCEELQVSTIQYSKSLALSLQLPTQKVESVLGRQFINIFRMVLRKKIIIQCITIIFQKNKLKSKILK